MKRQIWLLACLVIAASWAQAKLQRVAIQTADRMQLKELASDGRLDVLTYRPKTGLECLAEEGVVKELAARGYQVRVILDDARAHYRALKESSMKYDFGPFYTYAESQMMMDSLHFLYPTLVTARESIGVSRQGRVIYAFRVGNAPAGKPGYLQTGQTHAREPFGCNMAIEFARYLCQNYDNDSLVAFLLDNRQIWFIPIVNVDGSVYNSDTSGDGMWRKNRRNNSDGSFGVDLNRNYPYMWGYDNSGSSPYTDDETYRGPSAGSEPEVQAVTSFMDNKEFFRTALNYHTFSNLLVMPWGYSSTLTPDSLKTKDLAIEMTAGNGYVWGTPLQTVGYSVNGTSDDFTYETADKSWRCLGFTPEVGAEDFYEPQNLQSQIAENIVPTMQMAEAAGVYLEGNGIQISDAGGNGNGIADPGETVDMVIPLKNKAVFDTCRNASAVLSSSDPYLTITSSSAAYGDFNPRQSKGNGDSPFTVQVSSDCPIGHVAALSMSINADDGYHSYYPLTVKVGLVPGFCDNAEDTAVTNQYAVQSQWHLSTRSSYSPTHCWYCGDESSGQYSNNLNASLVTPEFGLSPGMQLSFWHKYDTEEDFDYGYLEYSTNGGAGWTSLDTFNGTQSSWTQQVYDLSGLPTGPLRLRFRLYSDGYVTADGWYLDDIRVGLPPICELSGGQVSPTQGDTATLFTYSLLYKSQGGHAPAESTAVIDGVPHSMNRISGTYTSGVTYSYQTKLPAGAKAAHQYFFQFVTQNDTFRLPDSGQTTGPKVYDILQTLTYTNDTDYAIPDNNPAGVWSYITVPDTFEVIGIRTYVHIAHTFIGDLWAILRGTAGPGDSIVLHNRSGGSADSLIGWYPTALTPYHSLNYFIGHQSQGQWGLHVTDRASTDLGTIRQWRLELTRGVITGVSSQPMQPDKPQAFILGAAHPNPTRAGTSIQFGLPRASQAELGVYNILGQKVATLASGLLEAGYHTIRWDARNQQGRRVSAGVYLYRLEAPGYSGIGRLTVLR